VAAVVVAPVAAVIVVVIVAVAVEKIDSVGYSVVAVVIAADVDTEPAGHSSSEESQKPHSLVPSC